MVRNHPVSIKPIALLLVCLAAGSAGVSAQVVITELMYHPPDSFGADAEFLELANFGNGPAEVGGWCFRGITYCFDPGTELGPGQYVVLTADLQVFEQAWGMTAHGQYTGALSNSGERIRLLDHNGQLVDVVEYLDVWPWPVTPDGMGPSLEVIDPVQDNNTPRNWRASVDPSGHTAGRANSVYDSGLPPWIEDVQHEASPLPGSAVLVTARVSDATGVGFAYRINFAPEIPLAMNDEGENGDQIAGDGIFSATIPGQPAGRLVRYRITAVSVTGARMDFPRTDDSVVYTGTVVQSPGLATQLPVFDWFMDPARYQAAIAHALTDETEPAVLAYGGRIWDSVQVRVRGGSARWWPKLHWKFVLPQGHDFEAPELLVRPVDRFNLQGSYGDKSYLREVLAYESFAAAGVPSNQVFHVRLHQNGAFFGLYVFLEQPDDDWFTRHGISEDGAHYKAYAQAEAVGSEAELHALYEKETREDEDFSDLFEFLQGINQNDPESRRNYVLDHVDIPAMVNYLAVQAIIHNNDHVAKNYYLYRDTTGTRRWTMYPWDMDLTFGRNYLGDPDDVWGLVLNDTMWADVDRIRRRPLVSPSHPLFGDQRHQKWDYLWNRLIDALYREPEIRNMYFRRLRTLMDQMLAPGILEARIDELADRIRPEAGFDRNRWLQYGTPQSLDQAIQDLKSGYLEPRREHLFQTHRVPGEIPRPQSADAAVFISEIMYQPSGGSPDEFLELFNPDWDEAVDISGWSLEGLDLALPPGLVVPPRGFVLLVREDQRFRATYGPGVLVAGRFGRNLDDAGQELTLKDGSGRIVDRVAYGSGPDWPQAARGEGASLERLAFDGDATLAGAWAAGPDGGSPGRPNQAAPAPLTRLIFPLTWVPGTGFTGFSISNPLSPEPLRLRFQVRDADGLLLALPANPAELVVPPHGQQALLAGELLGGSGSGGWVLAEVAGSAPGSLCQLGGGAFLDGFVALSSVAKELFLTQAISGPTALRGRPAANHFAVVNPHADPARLRLTLVDGLQGNPRTEREHELPGGGALFAELGELFGMSAGANDYVRIEVIAGAGGVAAAQAIRLDQPNTLIGLNAVPRNAASELFSAQLAISPEIFTQLKLINVASGTRTVRVTPVSEEGSAMSPPLVRTLQPSQSLVVDAGRDFALQSLSTVVGSVHIETDRPGIVGDVLFGDPAALAFAASLPLQSAGRREAVFSQVANLGEFFTGLALFNPGPDRAEITLEVYTLDGNLSGRSNLSLRAGERVSQLLAELVPASATQVRGYLLLRSTEPIMAQELFGTGDLRMLSSVPSE